MLFAVLGPLRVDLPVREVRVGGARRRTVLLRLLATPNRSVSTELLAEDVWEGKPPGAAASTLQSHVSALRQLLGPDRLTFEDGGYRVRVAGAELDVSLFEEEVAQGRAELAGGNAAAGLRALERALGRWRGRAFADAAGTAWTLIPAAHLEEERHAAIEDALEARLALGFHHEVCRLGEQAVAETPFRERRWALLMLALYRAGRQAEALRCYQRAREKLSEELGIDPSPQLAGLEHDILVQSPALAWGGRAEPVMTIRPVASARDETTATNLPAPVSRFVGRQAELVDLQKLLGAYRLVSLVGPGGIGKTRLAIEAAGSRVQHTRDGVWFVDLSSLSDPVELPGAVAVALGVRPGSDAPLEALLLERVRDFHALIVFDNCEHLVDDVAALIERLLEVGPGLRVLSTSREALRVPGEQVWQTPPISTPPHPDDLDATTLREFDAIRLFIERAQPPAGEQEPGAAELRLVAALTAKLDGLPLAIESAAARVESLGLAQLASLDDRLGILSRGSRTNRSRHRTLQATIDWSYQLLPHHLRAAFRCLSVFAGGFTIEAARSVLSSIGDVEKTVALLAERSLLVVDQRTIPGSPSTTRYHMLESIRQFAAMQLRDEDGPGAEVRVRAAHSSHFAELAARAAGALVGWQQGAWLTSLEDEYANLRAAISHLLDQIVHHDDALRMIVHLDRFWHNRGHLADCTGLLRRGLGLASDNLDTDLRCAALNLAGQAAISRDAAAAVDHFSECLVLARAANHDYQAALALAGLAWAGLFLGDPASGLVAGREAVNVARRVGDPVLLGQCLVCYGLNTVGDLALCQAVYQEAIAVTRGSGRPRVPGLGPQQSGQWTHGSRRLGWGAGASRANLGDFHRNWHPASVRAEQPGLGAPPPGGKRQGSPRVHRRPARQPPLPPSRCVCSDGSWAGLRGDQSGRL